LTALVDKSLLRRGAEGFYGMHELLKQYAAEMLEKDPQEGMLARDRHAAYYQLALDSLAKDLTGANPQPALRWIEREFEDIRAAWRWFLNQGELSSVVKIGNLMSRYYTISNRYQEAIQDYEFVISHLQDTPAQSQDLDAPPETLNLTRAYAMAWYWNFSEAMGEGRDAEAHPQGVQALVPSEQAAGLSPAERAKAYRQESLELAEQLPANDRAAIYLINRFGAGILDEQQVTALYQFSLEIFNENGSSRDQAYTRLVYGGILEFQDFKTSMQLYEEGLEISRQVGDPWIISIALLSLAQTLYFNRGSYDRAQGYLLEALQIARQLGDSWLVIGVLIWLGQVGTALGQYEPAIAFYQECLALVREKGDRRMTAILLACLGHVHYLKKENTEAQQAFEESLEICQATDDQHEMGMAYGNLGNVARAQGDYARAREHFLQSIELLERTGERWGLCLNTKRLGHCYSEMGEIELAWETYRRAMQLALQHDLPAEMLEILLGLAGLLARQGEPGRAIELASLVLAQSATSMDTRESAMQLLGEIECSLPEGEFAAAWQRGRALQLQAVAESYLP
jgi:tetratricopeptide (TPR) repeat protein